MHQRILFFGSHIQSYRCLNDLLSLSKHQVVGVVLNAGTATARDDQDVRVLAEKHRIPVVSLEEAEEVDFDLGIALLFNCILKPRIFERAPKGVVNFHLGPLPRLRGSNSVLHAIRLARIENIWTFGVTMHYIEGKLDAGPIIDVQECPIFEDDTAGTLHARACDLVFTLYKRTIQTLLDASGRVPSVPQSGPSRFFRRGVVDHEIDLNGDPTEVYDRIRALTFPGKPKPYTMVAGRKIYLSLE